MKNILLALELKPNDSQLLEHARSLAQKYKAKLWLVHIAAPEPDFVGYEVGPQYIREQRAETLRKEHKQLQKMMDESDALGIECDALLIAGPTVESLEQEVKKLAIDMLIMGSHKRGFLYETFIGSTSEKMIQKVNIPLLIIPLQD